MAHRFLDGRKLRHTAALVLLACVFFNACSETEGTPGWYRMVPPIADNEPDTAAPLSKWFINPPKPYDSEAVCKADLLQRQTKAQTAPHDHVFFLWPGVPGTEALLMEQTKSARCAYSEHPQFRDLIKTNQESLEKNPYYGFLD
jgi:hypothetical protein